MYKAKIITISDLIKHPNADRLQIVNYNSMTFVVDNSFYVGQKVIVFPTDGQLSHEFCMCNNLYRDATKNKDNTQSGFFEDSRRVRAQPFRKVRSEGLIVGLGALVPFAKSESDIHNLEEGFEFDTFCGHPICNKYITDATRAAIKDRTKKLRTDTEYHLLKHFETEQMDFNYDMLPTHGLIILTEKMHGTSGRTGYVTVDRSHISPVANWINNLFRRNFFHPVVKTQYEYVSGTRNTIINNRPECTQSDGKEYFRWQVHQRIIPKLLKGETVYYEIVGFDNFGSAIMNVQSLAKVKDKSLLGMWGEPGPLSLKPKQEMVYSYGCNLVHPNGKTPPFEVYVYRITQAGPDGNIVELPWFQVEKRCKEIGLYHVPVLGLILLDYLDDVSYSLAQDYLKTTLKAHLQDGPSTVDSRHLMEGVCIRIEGQFGMAIYKAKNWLFKLLESVVKEDDKKIDLEEAS